MSDLTATNCGCNDGGNGCGSLLWIIVLLCCCNKGSAFGDMGCNDGNSCLPILLLLLCCGGCGTNSLC